MFYWYILTIHNTGLIPSPSVFHHDGCGHSHSALLFCPTLHNRLPLQTNLPFAFIFLFLLITQWVSLELLTGARAPYQRLHPGRKWFPFINHELLAGVHRLGTSCFLLVVWGIASRAVCVGSTHSIPQSSIPSSSVKPFDVWYQPLILNT